MFYPPTNATQGGGGTNGYFLPDHSGGRVGIIIHLPSRSTEYDGPGVKEPI